MGLTLSINRSAEQPLYLQIAEQIRGRIRDGRLPVGTKLPPIRQMATDLGVTRPTVESAYDELRADGWVETTVGRGTFVAKTAADDEIIGTLGLNITPQGVLLDMPRIESVPVLRSLAYVEPDPELLPIEEFWGAMDTISRNNRDIFRYGPTQGNPSLRVELVNLLRERGVETLPENMIITTGATQGIALVMQALLRPGDVVAVEEPTHICLLNSIKARGLNPIGVTVDEDGANMDVFERTLVQYKPRVFFTVPNFHNPTGVLMSTERRHKLLELSKQHGVIIVEDDVYGTIAFDDAPPPALKSLDEDDRVVYISSASKVLMNGLRLGYMVAPHPLLDHLLQLKYASDTCTPPMTQHVLTHFIQNGSYKAHLKRIVPAYAERRNAVIRALNAYMPTGVTWLQPKGGLLIWLQLPDSIDSVTIHRLMLRQGFAFTPGDAFFSHGKSNTHLRICYGSQSPYVIDEAIRVLGQVVREEMAKGTPPYVPPLM